jgi:hypothetical protein
MPYSLTMPWDSQKFRRQTKRSDPELYPPEKIEVVVDAFAMAYLKETPEEQTVLDTADKVEVKVKADTTRETSSSTQSSRERRSSGPPGGIPGMSLPPTGGGAGMAMPATGSEGDDSTLLGGAAAMAGGAMPGMAGIAGMSGGGRYRQVPASYLAEMPGFRPGTNPQGVIAKGAYAAIVKAVVPWKKQFAEYEQKLAESVGYNPQRDVPNYNYFEAERAEVPADPNQPLEWEVVCWTKQQYEDIQYYWAGTMPEIVDPQYISPFLTMPVPPVLMEDTEHLALHSLVTKARTLPVVDPSAAPAKRERGEQSKPGQGIGQGPGALGAGGAQGMASGIPGMGMGMPGMGMPGMAMPSTGGGMPAGGMDPSMAMGGMMSGMSSAGMMGSGMMGGGVGAAVAPQVDYKLVRFFDMNVEPGKTYRYRIRVALSDPNYIDPNPRSASDDASGTTAPTGGAAALAGGAMGMGMGGVGGEVGGRALTLSALEDEVAARLKKQQAEDAANSTPENTIKTTWRFTEWSEPSQPVQVPLRPHDLIAGTVEADRISAMPYNGNARFEFPIAEASGKFVPVVWDGSLGVRVPLEKEVYRGSVLNDKQNVEIAHPLDYEFRQVKDYDFKTDAVVVDIRGGEPLPKGKSKKDEELTSPGEFLVMKPNGELMAANELEDLDEYRQTLFVDDKPSSGGGIPGMPGGASMADMMMGGAGGLIPGQDDKGGKGSRKRGSGARGMSQPPGGIPGMGAGMGTPPGMGAGGRRGGRPPR